MPGNFRRYSFALSVTSKIGQAYAAKGQVCCKEVATDFHLVIIARDDKPFPATFERFKPGGSVGSFVSALVAKPGRRKSVVRQNLILSIWAFSGARRTRFAAADVRGSMAGAVAASDRDILNPSWIAPFLRSSF